MSSTPKVSEVVFDIMHLELVTYIRQQHDVATYIASGMTPDDAQLTVDRLVIDRVMSLGESVGKRMALQLLEGLPPIEYIHQYADQSVQKYLNDLWHLLFQKKADHVAIRHHTPGKDINMSNSLPTFMGSSTMALNALFTSPNQPTSRTESSIAPVNTPIHSYTLRDDSFKWTRRFSPAPDTIKQYIQPYTWLAAGIIRGALLSLGLQYEVTEQIEIQRDQLIVWFRIEH